MEHFADNYVWQFITTVTGEAPETVRFAARVQLDSYGVVVADWRRRSHLKPSFSRTARPSTLIFWLLLVAGDVEANPGPTSQRCPCTRCGKTVKNFDRGIQCDRCEIGLTVNVAMLAGKNMSS